MEAVMGAGSILDGIFLLLVLSQHHADSTKICSKSSNFPLLQQNNKLPNHEIASMTTEGPVKCAYNCMTIKMCQSFNFDTNTGNCQLNHATLSPGGLNASHLVTTPEFVFSDISQWPQTIAGACANHNCSVNRFCEPLGNDRYTCSRLVTPSSCAEVKECDPSSTDGEYWLRLLNFDLYRTRIYCHNMNTDTPVEYLTLLTPNYGIYPNVTNIGCNQETSLVLDCKGRGGEAFYHKIRVLIENMEVVRNEKTFADFSNYKEIVYANAMDCYTAHNGGVLRSCGTKGEFTVNLTDTGWIVGPDQEWATSGWRAIIESIERDDTGAVVHMKCGGYAGGCHPAGSLMLKPYYKTAIPDSSAKEVTCPR
ncbi:A disintegrin and metalloproteinase with thrombospondin motifs 9-like [Haliotis rufescens]|uniref:A disintegrin and metalloproteinase with thrombospondin motifs 9-like n=1 Tax=Haliotis rufescens TaxID=6454 RepID=UPI00201F95BF|nr:A disintegrin and metalloproteinase with thrombospondin motifs 9-like [Haliotis rufescens]XP_046351954.2 A disintegrin and metalloproteinase with thrombospondin motifs 9-like [Haliotis rufescens]XP_046351955.2 A disintegrin and metalloproteinase with thrombospondin motifs 9-like [Haliotis rufescens]